MLKNTKSDATFVSILADGLMRVTVPEGTEGAVKRDYETSDGKTGTKWEMVYTELTGKITKIKFFDGDFGKLIQLTITDEEEVSVVLSVSTSSNFGEDIMKKLPNVDLEEGVKIVPYAFDDEKGKKKKGVTIYQDEEKIKNFYYDEEKKEVSNGYPKVVVKKGKKFSTEEWKLYFGTARLFLIEDITERFKIETEVSEEEDDDFEGELVKESNKKF